MTVFTFQPVGHFGAVVVKTFVRDPFTQVTTNCNLTVGVAVAFLVGIGAGLFVRVTGVAVGLEVL